MRKFFIFLIVAITTTSIAMAQEIDKLSAGTQMFLLMRSEEVKNGPQKAITENKFKLRPEVEKGYKAGFAPTEVVNNQEMIDAFIYLKDVNNTSSLESLGVVVMCKFEKYVTAKIPVDCIEKVANIDNVVQIDVSRLLQPKTDVASTVTNADKAWNGINNGLCEEYTGKGVLVGVIDQGIDFKHVAFTDENGNSRVKRVYAPGRSSSVYTSNFPDYEVGYSDHTKSDENMMVLTTAYNYGATIIEKHFTLDKSLPGNDHCYAMDSKDVGKFKSNIDFLSKISGYKHKQLLICESSTRKETRRSIVAKNDIGKGSVISQSDIAFKRPGTGISPADVDDVIGKVANVDISKDTLIAYEMLNS